MTNKHSTRWLASQIRYEEAPGVHTYHVCQRCKEHSTRAGVCAWCLRLEILRREGGDETA